MEKSEKGKRVVSYGEMMGWGMVGAALLTAVFSFVTGPGVSELNHNLFEAPTPVSLPPASLP